MLARLALRGKRSRAALRPRTSDQHHSQMSQPALAIYPRNDLEFVAVVYALAIDHADVVELQARLRERNPLAVVRQREISSEPTRVWYVYRDGRWNPASPNDAPVPR